MRAGVNALCASIQAAASIRVMPSPILGLGLGGKEG